jgi:thymidine kinase
MSELNLVLGPMFAGKSTYLINKATDLIDLGAICLDKILLINHSSDSRYANNKICTHNGIHISALSLTNLSDIVNEINKETDTTSDTTSDKYKYLKYIFIDEGQFFNDLYESIKLLLKNTNLNIQITICGLDGDFKQEPFENSKILDLIPYATNITKLTAKCFTCGNTAPFTKRITKSNETILVGGADDYQPVCILHLS